MLLAFVALFSITRSWGRHLNELGVQMGLGAPPLFGQHDPRTPMAITPAVVFALGAVLWGPRVASAAPWRRLVFGSVAAAGVWAVLLAVADGTTALVEPLTHDTGYFPLVARINSPGAFVDSFVERLATYPVHVQGHPPGIVLFLWALGRAGLHGQWPAAATFVIAGASAAGAALVGVNEIAGERLARSAAPFLVLTPMAIWIATTADALWLGISAWGVALFVVAAGRSGRMGDMWALAAGLLLGAALMMSYGIAPLAAVLALEVWRRAAVRQALIAATGVAAIAAAFAIFGFWWHEGLSAATTLYHTGIASRRPGGYFFVNNLAAFSLALGPAVWAAIHRLRDPRMWVLCGGALLAALASNISGLSKGEVERIWLPFVPWLLIATSALSSPGRRFWLGAQGAVAIAVQLSVKTW